MKKEINEGLKNIIQAISNMIEPKLATLKYDKTYRAKVIKKITNNKYKVAINGKEYDLPYLGELQNGEIIKVKAPLNNFSDIYIETSLNNYNVPKIR